MDETGEVVHRLERAGLGVSDGSVDLGRDLGLQGGDGGGIQEAGIDQFGLRRGIGSRPFQSSTSAWAR